MHKGCHQQNCGENNTIVALVALHLGVLTILAEVCCSDRSCKESKVIHMLHCGVKQPQRESQETASSAKFYSPRCIEVYEPRTVRRDDNVLKTLFIQLYNCINSIIKSVQAYSKQEESDGDSKPAMVLLHYPKMSTEKFTRRRKCLSQVVPLMAVSSFPRISKEDYTDLSWSQRFEADQRKGGAENGYQVLNKRRSDILRVLYFGPALSCSDVDNRAGFENSNP